MVVEHCQLHFLRCIMVYSWGQLLYSCQVVESERRSRWDRWGLTRGRRDKTVSQPDIPTAISRENSSLRSRQYSRLASGKLHRRAYEPWTFWEKKIPGLSVIKYKARFNRCISLAERLKTFYLCHHRDVAREPENTPGSDSYVMCPVFFSPLAFGCSLIFHIYCI